MLPRAATTLRFLHVARGPCVVACRGLARLTPGVCVSMGFGWREAAMWAADEGVKERMWRSLGLGAGARRAVNAVGARCTQFRWCATRNLSTVHAVLGPLARAARSFAPRYTQVGCGARSFFLDQKEGSPHLPARLMLHAVFGASETACTVSQLRVAWAETACTVPQLRVAWDKTACSVLRLRVACVGGLRQGPKTTTPASLPSCQQPTWPTRISLTAAQLRMRRSLAPDHKGRHILSLTLRPQPMMSPCVSRNAAHMADPRKPNHPTYPNACRKPDLAITSYNARHSVPSVPKWDRCLRPKCPGLLASRAKKCPQKLGRLVGAHAHAHIEGVIEFWVAA